MTEANKPRFSLTMQVCEHEGLTSENPTIVDDKLVHVTFNMLGVFIEETLDDLGLEANETRLRELVVEMCYRLILREMFTLNVMPGWEENWKERLGTKKKGPPIHKKGSYDDSDWH